MKKLIVTSFLTLVLALTLQSTSSAQHSGVGVGFMVGEPTGLSIKSWTGGGDAFDIGLAWSMGRYDAVNIHADYLWHNYEVFNDVQSGSMPLYFGIGGRAILSDNRSVIGARIPAGINYLFEEAPIGLFVEVAPIFNVAPSTDFDVDGALGVRFYL